MKSPTPITLRALLLLGMTGVVTVLSAKLAARREAALRAARMTPEVSSAPVTEATDTSDTTTADASAKVTETTPEIPASSALETEKSEKTPKSPCSPPCRNRVSTVDPPCKNSAIFSQKPAFASKNEALASMIALAHDRAATAIPCPEYDPEGYPRIHAMWLEGMEMDGVPTRAFAYIGFPEGASPEASVPGVVLQHGGGGYAFPYWVDLWNKRGYAAIAVANTGYRPRYHHPSDFYSPEAQTHEVPPEATDAWTLPPDNDGMFSVDGPIDRMWMYHAVTQTILANSLLRADPRVDAEKIGLTGISWGGVITSIAIGYDPRFAFAIPVYGSGYLQESLSWMKDHFRAHGVAELWDASLRLRDVKISVLWLAWSSDSCFSVNTNCRSCSDTENGERCFLLDLGHGHIEGWTPAEIYRFADACIGRGEGLTGFVTQPETEENAPVPSDDGGAHVTVTIRRPADATRITARLLYLTEPMTYSATSQMEQVWSVGKATVKGNRVTAVVPAEAMSYYIEVCTCVGREKFISCSRYVVRENG